MSVQMILAAGTDLDVVNGARVSVNRESDVLSERDEGLIARLMNDGHSSPFAQCWAKFRIECSIGAARQIARHGHYIELNEHSTRYSEMPAAFVTPPLKAQVGKAMDYRYEPLGEFERQVAERIVDEGYDSAYRRYEMLLELGVAREDARYVLPLGMQTRLIASSHLKGWLRFLAQRTDPHAQDEIRDIAHEIELHLAEAFPVSISAWDRAGRRAP